MSDDQKEKIIVEIINKKVFMSTFEKNDLILDYGITSIKLLSLILDFQEKVNFNFQKAIESEDLSKIESFGELMSIIKKYS